MFNMLIPEFNGIFYNCFFFNLWLLVRGLISGFYCYIYIYDFVLLMSIFLVSGDLSLSVSLLCFLFDAFLWHLC